MMNTTNLIILVASVASFFLIAFILGIIAKFFIGKLKSSQTSDKTSEVKK